jgi:NTP pyrophosphatase (non-canonical NTP hydrolase)
MDGKTKISELKAMVKRFNDERDWDQFHNAKDLAIAVSVEAAEILEHFVYKSSDEVDELFKGKKRGAIEDEVADTFWAILMLAERYDIDLSNALEKKMLETAKRYPIAKAKGSNKKYTEL